MRPLRAAPNGLLTTRQFHDRRFTTKQIEILVRWQWLIRLHQGVYLVPAPDVLARAALTAAGGGELCMESALAHLDLRPRVPGPTHVNLATAGHRGDRGGLIRIHRARIPEDDVVEVRGLRTTTPTRSLLDVARRQPCYALFRALEQAERLRAHVDRSRLAACPHFEQPLELFDHYGACTRSDAEAMFLVLCEDHGIERPLVNRPLGGRECDFQWPQTALAVEVDGFEAHDGLSPFHDDRQRGTGYRLSGFELVRFSADQVAGDAARVAAAVLAARPRLARRR
jgi:very-short-patch-repair endonuclease